MKTKIKNQVKGVMNEIIESKFQKSLFDIFLTDDYFKSNDDENDLGPDLYSTYSKAIKRYPDLKVQLSTNLENQSVAQNNLKLAKKLYGDIINNPSNKELFKTMALLETIIIQTRCMLNAEVKLTLVNQKRGESETSYVVARAPFFNPENVKPEIRVYLGKTEELGSDLEQLSKDKSFMISAQTQIVQAMYEVMKEQNIFERIKKSSKIKVRELVSVTEADTTEDNHSHNSEILKRREMFDPYSPSKGPNPKPKTIRFLKL